ncbi:hypothetical protein MKZ38_002904 [Zalerion maritima]|uniref:TLC domain-containing protein n=1 Tax=Zalerion maritima TaxID=339359 RepID=A0AAD5RPJ0_9PEZI|nr:hypothetical protein MKZ38_002904 [Zalerion maritima]
MRDPFPIPPSQALASSVEPLASYFSLTTLPLHIHEVLAACVLYTVINVVVSPALSTWLFPNHYGKMSATKKLNWDVHVVSFIQAILINSLALWVIWVDTERSSMDPSERVYGYTGAAGMIQALAAGYFLWDLVITAIYLPVFGMGMLTHAVSALTVFSFGFRPFVNYYGCVFILWELSSPFLNIHWFCDKLGMTGSRLQLYNGFALIFTFFSCRLVYGTYQSTRVFSDVWTALHQPEAPTNDPSGVLLFSDPKTPVPTWLAVVYLGSNITLNTLNFFWFFKMIEAVRKRFVPKPEAAPVHANMSIDSASTNGEVVGKKPAIWPVPTSATAISNISEGLRQRIDNAEDNSSDSADEVPPVT